MYQLFAITIIKNQHMTQNISDMQNRVSSGQQQSNSVSHTHASSISILQSYDKNGIFFSIFALIIEGICIGVCSTLIEFDYDELSANYLLGDIYLSIGLSVFAIIGIGLVNLNEVNGTLGGFALTLLMFSMNIMHYLVFSVMWKAIFWGQCYKINNNSLQLTVVNTQSRTYLSEPYAPCQISLSQLLICTISINLTLTQLMPRLTLRQICIISVIGVFFYGLNEQIIMVMSVFDVYDVGHGFKIFVFGSGFSTVCYLINAKQISSAHDNHSDYSTRTLGFLGVIIMFVTFPFIYFSGFYRYSVSQKGMNPLTIYIVIFNIVFGLVSALLGCIAITTIIHKKIHIMMIINSALSGGVVMSFSSHLHRNLAIPLAVGFGTGAIQAIICYFSLKELVKLEPRYMVLCVNRFLIPSIIGGVLLSICSTNIPSEMFIQSQHPSSGGYKFAQLLISLSLGSTGGLLTALPLKFLPKSQNKPSPSIFLHQEQETSQIKLK